MAFSRDELKDLLILRNKASHTASRPGVEQLVAVVRSMGVLGVVSDDQGRTLEPPDF
jgi:hypothetical protein